jgi:RNA polymerase sigma factor (sigma-70 family)
MSSRNLDIDALYSRHRDELLLFLVRRTADTEIALDIWAETFAQAVSSRARYRGATDVEAAAWLFKIAQRQLARYYRRGSAERRTMRRLGLERPQLSPDVEADIVRRAGLDAVRGELMRAVASLSADAREAITLRVLEELPYPDVAARLAISEQTARMRVSRGLRALAGLMDTQLITEALER